MPDTLVPSARAEVERLAYSPREAARALGCSHQTVYNLITSGALRSVCIGARRLIPRDELERLLRVGGVTS